MTKPLPKGFVCLKCQKEIHFSTYVYAHWDDLLDYMCECKKKYVVTQGKASSGGKKAKAIERKESK